MDEQGLLKVALICALTGILVLIFISNTIEIKQYQIKDITKKMLDKDVQVTGEITRITETPGLYIFDIKDKTGTITAIVFKEGPIELEKNQEITLQGTVKEYKDKLEIVAEQITSN